MKKKKDTFVRTGKLTITCKNKLKLSDIGDCDIVIYMSEQGKVPHIHIIGIDNQFESCICLYEPKYYSHDIKINTLTDQQILEFSSFMNEKQLYVSNYSEALTSWNVNIGTKFCKPIRKMPDYNKLHNKKFINS